MFDIGFFELVMIAIVALVVVGPEKLPSLVRTILIYLRKIRSGYQSVRDEVERELDLDGIKNELDSNKTDFKNVIGYDELHESLDSLKKQSQELIDDDLNDPLKVDLTQGSLEQDDEKDSKEPFFPNPDENEDTGVEADHLASKNNQ